MRAPGHTQADWQSLRNKSILFRRKLETNRFPRKDSHHNTLGRVWRWRQQADHNQLVMLCSSYRVATDITSWSCNGQSNGRLLAAQTPEYSTAVQQYRCRGWSPDRKTGVGRDSQSNTEPNTQSDRQPVVVELSLQCSDLLLAWEPLQLSSVFCVVADN